MNRSPTLNPSADADRDIERLARRRAGLRFGWIIHAAVFVLVNTTLAALAWATGRHWAVYPLLGWGLGLAIHGVAVLLSGAGAQLHQRLVQQERARLAQNRW